jgi:hypothetical protein
VRRVEPVRDINVFAEGAQVFSFHSAAWHLLDLKRNTSCGRIPS